MKKQICVTVDIETLLIAQTKIPNISSYLNDCLKGLSGITREDTTKKQLEEELTLINNSLTELSIRKSIKEMELKRIIEEVEEKDRKLRLEEQNKRWVCPVCLTMGRKVLNELDNVMCQSCLAKSKNSPRTTYEYINKV